MLKEEEPKIAQRKVCLAFNLVPGDSKKIHSISQINFINNLSFIFKDEKWIVVHLAPGIVPHPMARTNSVWETSRIRKPSLQTKD